jgi:NAD(P)-dependent dehydrogenase (short-subunit alcohol dehydrogenase family)
MSNEGMVPVEGTTCLVTGATSGIGKATAARLAELGATVIAVARGRARGAQAANEIQRRAPRARVEVLTADLSRLGQVRRLAAQVQDRYDRLDVLVNNAGVAKFRPQLTPDGLGVTLATNHLGPFLLTNLLLDQLKKSAPARVVTVSSDRHTRQRSIPWDDLELRHDCSYKASKLLNILFTYELAGRLAGTGVTANCLSPGFVRTELGREATGAFGVFLRLARPFQSSPEAGAQTSVYLATSPAVAEVSGRYFEKCAPAESSAVSRDPAAAKRLWRLSTHLSGLDAELPTTGQPGQLRQAKALLEADAGQATPGAHQAATP